MNAALAAHTACVWEVLARKVGNVHPNSSFADLNYIDFLHSAGALTAAIANCALESVGETILRAVRARRDVTPSNTNLGIILLLVPLAKSRDRAKLGELLASLTIDDARRAYEAIRIASAGGLGEVPEQSVAEEPTVTLLEAMHLASERDSIAKQYLCGFADIFDFGVPHLLRAFELHGSVEAAIIECQLQWLASFPDSLVARKNGLAIALELQQRVKKILELGGLQTEVGRDASIRLDRMLGGGIPDERRASNHLNPGTTADLVTACLFVALRDGKLKPSDPFSWPVPDWL